MGITEHEDYWAMPSQACRKDIRRHSSAVTRTQRAKRFRVEEYPHGSSLTSYLLHSLISGYRVFLHFKSEMCGHW